MDAKLGPHSVASNCCEVGMMMDDGWMMDGYDGCDDDDDDDDDDDE